MMPMAAAVSASIAPSDEHSRKEDEQQGHRHYGVEVWLISPVLAPHGY